MDKRIANAVVVVVTTVWAMSFIADIVSATYDPSPFLHLAMMAVVGAAVGHSVFKREEPK